MNNHKLWQGERVRLRAVEPEDWEIFSAWDADSETARQCYAIPFPKSYEAVRKWALEQSLAVPESDVFRFVTEPLEGEFVGALNTHDCDPRNGTFSYGLAIRREQRRKGYASETIWLALRYFFRELRYQKVTVQIYTFNEASLKLHEKLGFVLEGRLRRMVFTNGQYHDEVIMGMTDEEFEAYERSN
jgi:RimJ/RimL family protein N-acetyltransferase